MLLSLAILALSHPALVFSIAWNQPTQTAWQAVSHNASPVQTVFPELLKRDTPPTSVCGYVSGQAESSITCAFGDYCGFYQSGGNFGCCTTYVYSNSQYSLYGCDYYSTCYQTTPLIGQSQTSALYCTAATAPHCIEYQYSAVNEVYSALGCSAATGVFQVESSFGSFSTSPYQSSQEIQPATAQGSTTTQSFDIPTQASVSIPIVITQTQKTAGGSGASVSIPGLPALPTKSRSSRNMSCHWSSTVGIVLAILSCHVRVTL